MSNGEITREIERFIHDNINSVEQLEVLLLIAAAPQRGWNALDVSQKLHRQPESVAMRLADLQKRGFLSVEPEAVYRYACDARQNALVEGLGRAYQVRQDAVIALIFTRPADNLRAFSDAFRIRRDS